MSREYKDLVFSKHAMERAQSRSIAPDSVYQALHFPDRVIKNKENNSQKFSKIINDRKYQVVAKYLAKEKKWLVVSVWVRGENDKAPFVWQLITLPFKLIYWVIKLIWNLLAKIARKK